MSFDWDNVEDFFNSDMTEAATYLSKSYQVVRFARKSDAETMAAGLLAAQDFRLGFKLADLAANSAELEERAVVSFGGVEYRIREVETDSTGKMATVTLGGKNQ